MIREWESYKINIPQGTRRSGDGEAFENVNHVVHLAAARRILEDGRLKAGLVYDESVLKSSRIGVTWLSANTWGLGSIYGNVQFTFPWSKLIAGRNCYWVEVMADYRPPAFRILFTDRDLSDSAYIKSYDPSSDDGPLRQDKGIWYRNPNYTSEFMLEADIPLDDCIGLDFIQHHSTICRPYRSACTDRSSPPPAPGRPSPRVLAGE